MVSPKVGSQTCLKKVLEDEPKKNTWEFAFANPVKIGSRIFSISKNEKLSCGSNFSSILRYLLKARFWVFIQYKSFNCESWKDKICFHVGFHFSDCTLNCFQFAKKSRVRYDYLSTKVFHFVVQISSWNRNGLGMICLTSFNASKDYQRESL